MPSHTLSQPASQLTTTELIQGIQVGMSSRSSHSAHASSSGTFTSACALQDAAGKGAKTISAAAAAGQATAVAAALPRPLQPPATRVPQQHLFSSHCEQLQRAPFCGAASCRPLKLAPQLVPTGLAASLRRWAEQMEAGGVRLAGRRDEALLLITAAAGVQEPGRDWAQPGMDDVGGRRPGARLADRC